MQKAVLTGDRAYWRLICKHIKGRGERRRLMKRYKAISSAARRERMVERVIARFKTFEPSKGTIVLRSWKKCSQVATAGGAPDAGSLLRSTPSGLLAYSGKGRTSRAYTPSCSQRWAAACRLPCWYRLITCCSLSA